MAVNKFDNSMLDADAIGTSANQLVQLDSNTKYPAVDGSLLTGIPSPFTASASDPTISTNPSGGVGTLWTNTSSGEVYCCTDATAGSNKWINVGIGSKDIPLSWTFGGEIRGYTAGGTKQGSNANEIDRYNFGSLSNATDVGDLTVIKGYVSGSSSETHGYTAGGHSAVNVIDKYHFSYNGNASDVGNLTAGKMAPAGVSSSHSGYAAGGNAGGALTSVIDKYSFSSDGNSTDAGDLTANIMYIYGSNSSTHGYTHGGYRTDGPGTINTINKFSTVSNANATDVGDLTVARNSGATGSSSTHGYCCGGDPLTNRIDKISFSSDGDATDVADMVYSLGMMCGQSSTTDGYATGGSNGDATVNEDYIQKYPFSSNTNATDIANLTVARYFAAPSQV